MHAGVYRGAVYVRCQVHRCVQGDHAGQTSGAQVCAGVYMWIVQVRRQVHRCMQVCTWGLCR